MGNSGTVDPLRAGDRAVGDVTPWSVGNQLQQCGTCVCALLPLTELSKASASIQYAARILANHQRGELA